MKASLRIATVQFTPAFKDVSRSISIVDRLLADSKILPNELDLLILPEMAFTGYCFEGREDVEPFAEDVSTGEGPTTKWAVATAKRLHCYVLVGFPQRVPSTSTAPDTLHNSLLIVNPSGTVEFTYQKHFLFTTDETWATPGPSFISLDLAFPPSNPIHVRQPRSSPPEAPTLTFRLLPCICMDVNPYRFEAPFDSFELATFAKGVKPDIVVCSMAWLDSDQSEEAEKVEEKMDEWDKVRPTVSYWATRMRPLLGSAGTFVACNRTGREGDVAFTGSSCVLALGEPPEVVDHASKRGEKVLRATVSIDIQV
ncbi:protein N-terminal amidase [Pseudohyphozyma bogoriensis]|nr:protein N-terminal amidase [Pseudohyphozyma bogoriensis]